MAREVKVGDVFVGNNGERVDLFVILKDEDRKEYLNIMCLTRCIGWERGDGKYVNQFEKGLSVKELPQNYIFDCEYATYTFKRVKKIIPNSFFKSYVKETN